MASVKVAIRVRPLNKREEALGSSLIVKVDGNVIQVTNSKMEGPPYDVFSTRDKVKQFTFDHSYWSVDPSHENYASQEKIFEDLGVGVVESAFSGYNACIFAYGQTGSGKTHTMMGAENNPGLTPRICEGIFANMDKPDLTYRTEVSYLEIYNERVRDLLREGVQATSLKVREHAKDGPYVQDLSRRVVTSYREIEGILRKGNINRTTASTGMNEHSSRSHAIFTIYFSQARISGDLPSEINSKIHLVDLAGSERADTAGTTGDRLREGGSINKSLVILGNVISALAEMNDPLSNVTTSSLLSSSSSTSSSSATLRRFIPYRNSVLTWLLKDSLGGNSRTVMVATISPADCCYAETLSTLRYAKRAKKIVNMPSVNEDGNVRLIRELRAENAKLKRMLADAMMQEGLTPPSEVEETREKLSKNEEKIRVLWSTCSMYACERDEHSRVISDHAEGMESVFLSGMSEMILCQAINTTNTSAAISLPHIPCNQMQELMEAWTDKWKEVINVLKEHEMLALRKEGSGVLLDSGLPYLLCIDDSVLSTGMKLYHIKEGDTIVGRDNPIHRPDIVLSGRFIENIHCIVRFERGHCFLIPSENAMCCIDSIQVIEPTKLTQGSMIQLGRNHFFRFNHPAEAAKLRKEMNEGYDRGNMSHIWKDIQRAWSTFSLTDSAIDSDISLMKADARLKDWLDSGVEEKKMNDEFNITKNSDEKNDTEPDGITDQCPSLAEAQLKLKMLNEKIENELKSEDKSEDDNQRDIGVEYEILRMEKERQEEEWCELEKQKHHQHSLRVDDQIILNKHQEHLEKIREAEKKIWSGEIEEMRTMMDEEVQQLCDGRARTSCTPTSSDDSSIDGRREAPAGSCHRHGNSFDCCRGQKAIAHHDTFECSSLDSHLRHMAKVERNFPLLHSSNHYQSMTSGGTFEDLLPSDLETFKLSTPAMDDLMGECELRFSLDFQVESISNSISLSIEEETQTQSYEKSISNLYSVIRSMYVDEFKKSSRLMRHPTKHLQLARQLNEKLLTISKHISRSKQVSPDHLIQKACDGKVELLENLLNLYDSLSIMSHQQSGSMFSEAAETLLKINKFSASSKQLLEEEFGDYEMKSLIQTEVCLRREMFLYEMSEHWDEMVRWSRRRILSGGEEGCRTCLDLKPAVNNRKKMKSICEAMHLCGSLDEKLKSFSKNFIVQILEPGIQGGFLPHSEEKPCLIEIINSSSFNFSLIPPNDEEGDVESPLNSSILTSALPRDSSSIDSKDPNEILMRVERSLRLLWCAFSFSLETAPSHSLTAIIGEHVCTEMIQLLCRHCLVPYFSALDFQSLERRRECQRYYVAECKAWKLFNDVLLKVYNLLNEVVQLGFLSSPTYSCFLQLLPKIRGYALNRCKQYMDCALEIGISTLGVSVNISSDHPIGPCLAGNDCKKVEEEEWSVEKFIVDAVASFGPLNMPFCSVRSYGSLRGYASIKIQMKINAAKVAFSLPSCDVVKLLYSLLHEAHSCCPLVSVLLQPCAEDIAEQFCSLLTNSQLPRNPAFDALLHNSCLFVAQHLMVVERNFAQQLPSVPVELREEVFSNEKNLRKIRDRLKALAERMFTESITRQREAIKRLLPPAESFACAADDNGQELSSNVMRILDTIQVLSNNWNGILSPTLYFKSIGVLIDELVSFMIKSILAVLEFSEEDCATLRKIIGEVINVAPNYFVASLSPIIGNVKLIIVENVPNWMRLMELHTFLSLTLTEIRDRWTSGLGPLSLHFTDGQVVSLIRAIFERTSGREAVIREIGSSPSVHIKPSL